MQKSAVAWHQLVMEDGFPLRGHSASPLRILTKGEDAHWRDAGCRRLAAAAVVIGAAHLVWCRVLRTIDDKDIDRTLLQFQFEPELFLQCRRY